MIFKETELLGAYIIKLQRIDDERGFFARSWCEREFRAHGLDHKIVQCNISFNKKRGTLRGMHYQVDPDAETRLVRCTNGVIYDVIVDLRPESSTYMHHAAVVLTAENRKMIYVPKGFAHGFQTLEDDTEVFYQMSEFDSPASYRGFRWDDAAFGITWPEATRTISLKDQSYPDFA